MLQEMIFAGFGGQGVLSMGTLLAYAALVVVYASLVQSQEQALALLQALLAATTVVACYGMLQYVGFNPTEHHDPLFRSNRINSTIGNSNFLGKYLAKSLFRFSLFLGDESTCWI